MTSTQASDARGALPLWLASIGDPFTAAEARDAAQAALDDADAVLRNVKLKFQGTLPPPPWPKTAALAKAIDEVEITRDAMAAFAEKAQAGAIDLHWPKTTGKVGPTLVRVGTALYTELATLEKAAANSDTVAMLTKLLPSPSALLGGLPALFLIGLLIWLWSTGAKVERLIEGRA